MAVSATNQKYLLDGKRVFFSVGKNVASLFFKTNLLLFLVSFLWARASLFGSFHPFALAAIATVNLVYPRGIILAVLGTTAGLMTVLPFNELVSYGLLLVIVLWGTHGAKKQGATLNYQLIFGAFYTAGAVLLGRIILATVQGEEPVFLYFAILEALLSGLFVAILSHFGTRLKDLANLSKRGGQEEITMLFLIVGIGIAGLDGIYLGAMPLQDMVLRLAVIIAAWAGGPGAGAIAGIAGGIVVALLSNFSPYNLAGMAMAGVCAGLFREMGKGGVIFGSIAGAALLSYQILTPKELLEVTLSAGGAGLCLALLPVTGILHIKAVLPLQYTEAPATAEIEEKRLRDWVSGRLVIFSEVLQELARGFAQIPKEEVAMEGSDISKMINSISERVCNGCPRYQVCWKEQFYSTFKNFEAALVAAENAGSLQANQLPLGIKGTCTQVHKLVQVVNYLLELHRVESTWEQKLISSREIVSGQLEGISEVINSLSQEMQERRCLGEDPSHSLHRAFLQKCQVREVVTVPHGDDQLEIRAVCLKCDGRESCRCLAPTAATVMETQYSLVKRSCGYLTGEPLCEISLIPEKAYLLESKVVDAAKKGARINGDNHLVIALPTGKMGIALSDGMGSGSSAALESSTTISLLEQLLRAGLDRRFAVRAINSLLLFRSPEESFATLDMVLFDEYTGEAEFVKIGCQPTYILRGTEILKIESRSLPIGILSQVDASIESVELYPNDYIIMTTDGVKDCNPELASDWFEKMLDQAPKQGAAKLADYLYERIIAACNGEPADDLTLSVARVRNRGVSDSIPVYTRKKVAEA